MTPTATKQDPNIVPDDVAPDSDISRSELAQTVKQAKRDPQAAERAVDYFLTGKRPDVEFDLHVTRLGEAGHWRGRVVTEPELKSLQKRATTGRQRMTGAPVIDSFLLNRILLVEVLVEPDMKDPKLLEVWPRPEDALEAMLLPGEIDGLAGTVMEKSGYGDNAVVADDPRAMDEVEQAKN